MNCTPFVRQYDILSNKWGVILCQKGYRINGIQRNSRKWLFSTEAYLFHSIIHSAHRKRSCSTTIHFATAPLLWLRGKDLNQRPTGYEMHPEASLSPFGPICPSCVRLSQSGWNHHSLRSSLSLSAFGSRLGALETLAYAYLGYS